VILTIVGAPPLVIAYRSKLMVEEAGQPLVRTEILTTPFTVRNEGLLAIHDLRADCAIDTLIQARTQSEVIGGRLEGVLNLPRLDVDVPATFGCWDPNQGFRLPQAAVIGGSWTDARVTFTFTYRTIPVPWTQHTSVSFSAFTQDNGELRWVPVPPFH
jgi:hypothetical protein